MLIDFYFAKIYYVLRISIKVSLTSILTLFRTKVPILSYAESKKFFT